jgi:hypothetical protein
MTLKAVGIFSVGSKNSCGVHGEARTSCDTKWGNLLVCVCLGSEVYVCMYVMYVCMYANVCCMYMYGVYVCTICTYSWQTCKHIHTYVLINIHACIHKHIQWFIHTAQLHLSAYDETGMYIHTYIHKVVHTYSTATPQRIRRDQDSTKTMSDQNHLTNALRLPPFFHWKDKNVRNCDCISLYVDQMDQSPPFAAIFPQSRQKGARNSDCIPTS